MTHADGTTTTPGGPATDPASAPQPAHAAAEGPAGSPADAAEARSQAPADTLTGCVAAFARTTPGADAAVIGDERLSYAALDAAARERAGALAAAGVAPGDRVGVLAGVATGEFVATLLGAWRLGAIAVPLNARFKARELGYVTRHAGLRLLVAEPALADLAREAGYPDDCRLEQLGALPGDGPGPDTDLAVHDADAVLLYTSGTTADPKGCVYTHRGMVTQGEIFGERCEFTAADRFWSPLPAFHIACWCSAFTAWTHGGAMLHVGRFDPAAALAQLEEERATVAFPAFETIWLPVLGQPGFDDADLSALRLVLSTGVEERLRGMQARLPSASQVGCTGSTEAGGFLAIGRATDPLDSRVTSQGIPLRGFEARVIDPETGADVGPGVPGELLYRGGSRFHRYWHDAETTAARIDADGWFHTEDLCTRAADGTLAYVGRLKDMLKVGGENVAAADVESHLLTHPAVGMVQVVAAPDARYQEVVAAYVVLADGATATELDLVEHCLGAIATYKVPRYVRFVAEFPMSGTKVQKFRLREAIADELRAAGITEAPRPGAA